MKGVITMNELFAATTTATTTSTSSGLEGTTIALIFAAIIALCVILCIVKICNIVQEIRDDLKSKLDQMQKDLHRISDEVAPRDKK